jgi:hypothetical protein
MVRGRERDTTGNSSGLRRVAAALSGTPNSEETIGCHGHEARIGKVAGPTASQAHLVTELPYGNVDLRLSRVAAALAGQAR